MDNNQKKKAQAEVIWLSYYNNSLFEAGVITEDERNKMIWLISQASKTLSNK